MSAWDEYPPHYRHGEVQHILRAACAGESSAVVGLSGSGKSNLLGFLARRAPTAPGCPRGVLVDCNRLTQATPGGFYRLLLDSLREAADPSKKIAAGEPPAGAPDTALLRWVELALQEFDEGRVCLLLDRFDAWKAHSQFEMICSNLRALRDRYKYRLALVTATRRPLPADNELAELLLGRTVWLGALTQDDARWSAQRDARRYTLPGEAPWPDEVIDRLVALSWGYPSFLRAACEAYADGSALEAGALFTHPALQRRVREFLSDAPDDEALRLAGLHGHPWLQAAIEADAGRAGPDESRLTAKESRLLAYLEQHAGVVCEKDDLVQAVWPEDVIFARGVRDESLAQLVRRLRLKLEADPADPQRLITIPGRGYLYRR